jgi:ABC-type multidrug transport system fused ATPase/permease subunit
MRIDPSQENRRVAPLPEIVTLDRVEMTMGQRRLLLKDFCFRRANVCALIGESGSGKSTLLKGLSGLWPTEVWQANCSQYDLSHYVSYLGQESFVFSGTLRDNLRYGNQASDSEIMAAAEFFAIDELLRQLSLDAAVNALHHGLSGGQLQRLALVRTWLRNRPIILLDEATSALDRETEDRVLTALLAKVRQEGKCLLMATHRVDRCQQMDAVYCVDSSGVVVGGVS